MSAGMMQAEEIRKAKKRQISDSYVPKRTQIYSIPE